MSRSGYVDYNDDQWGSIKYRGQVASAIRGKRGQKLLRDLRDALDAMPDKRLITRALIEDSAPSFIPPSLAKDKAPSVCALGSLGLQRGMEMRTLDPDDRDAIAEAFGVARQLICEIEYMNDEEFWGDDSAQRWQFMREWVEQHISAEKSSVGRSE